MCDNIKVVIRSRPLMKNESNVMWTSEMNCIYKKDKNRQAFQFDKVYDSTTETDKIYTEDVQCLVKSAMNGVNGTVFAYGQTGSGKTFTMTGDSSSEGMIQMAVSNIFSHIDNKPEREFLVRVSYIEIYQENVVDLLSDSGKFLSIKEIKNCVYVSELSENVATSIDDVMGVMVKGLENRHIGETKMNDKSSRSHSIFRVIIESKMKKDNESKAVIVSHLNFVDLAGSECAKQSLAQGQRLAEGCFINKSLLSLSNVIENLSMNVKFINYRNSKLTRILKNSLGGNSKTTIICTVSPSSDTQTMSTLRFATNAKKIKNKPIINEIISGESMLKKYRNQIKDLEKQLEQARGNSVQVNKEKIEFLLKQICSNNKEKKVDITYNRRLTWAPGKTMKGFSNLGQSFSQKPTFNPNMSIIMSDEIYEDENQDMQDIFDKNDNGNMFPTFKSPILPTKNLNIINKNPIFSKEKIAKMRRLTMDLNSKENCFENDKDIDKDKTITELRDYINHLLQKEADTASELTLQNDAIEILKNDQIKYNEKMQLQNDELKEEIILIKDSNELELKQQNDELNEKISQIKETHEHVLKQQNDAMNIEIVKQKEIHDSEMKNLQEIHKTRINKGQNIIDNLKEEISNMKISYDFSDKENNDQVKADMVKYKEMFEVKIRYQLETIEILKQDIKSRTIEINSLKENIFSLTTKESDTLKQHELDLEIIRENLNEEKELTEKLNDKLDHYEELISKGKIIIQNLKDEVKNAKEDKEDLDNEKFAQLRGEMKEMQENMNTKLICQLETIEIQKNTIDTQIQEINDLKDKQNPSARIIFLQKKADKYESAMEAMQEERNIARIDLASAENCFRKEKKELKEKCDYLNKRVPELRSENLRLRSELRSLKNVDMGESFVATSKSNAPALSSATGNVLEFLKGNK